MGLATINDSSSSFSSTSGLVVGDNLFVWTISSSCCPSSFDTVNVILSNSSQSTIADTALDVYTLNGQNYTQTGTYTQGLLQTLQDVIAQLRLI